VLLWLNASNLTNVGVQLSFLAVATIGIFNRDNVPLRRSALQSLLEESLPAWRRWGLVLWRHFLAGLRISFWVWLFTTPLIWHHFHVVSLVSIPLNVVLSIPLMVGLLAGLITPLVCWLPGVGLVTGAFAGFCLAIIEWLVDLTYSIPLGHVWLPSPPLWWSIIFYVGALVWLIVGRGTRQRSLAVVLVV
jgi:competence protein ComEC